MSAVELHQLTNERELDALVATTLQDAGVGLKELRRQAREGRFDSERFRRAWFVVRGLGLG